jgi:hypothetical protein
LLFMSQDGVRKSRHKECVVTTTLSDQVSKLDDDPRCELWANVEDHMETSVLDVREQFDVNEQLWFAQEITGTVLVEKVSSLVPENFWSARTL